MWCATYNFLYFLEKVCYANEESTFLGELDEDAGCFVCVSDFFWKDMTFKALNTNANKVINHFIVHKNNDTDTLNFRVDYIDPTCPPSIVK